MKDIQLKTVEYFKNELGVSSVTLYGVKDDCDITTFYLDKDIADGVLFNVDSCDCVTKVVSVDDILYSSDYLISNMSDEDVKLYGSYVGLLNGLGVQPFVLLVNK